LLELSELTNELLQLAQPTGKNNEEKGEAKNESK
jgi:hypothetical protein